MHLQSNARAFLAFAVVIASTASAWHSLRHVAEVIPALMCGSQDAFHTEAAGGVNRYVPV
jgi:hypothetical protein